ncbi:protein translocase subunit SecD [Actinopolymorpha singaporensis]|uniref:Multifunctional fusion protein n=1 Tax=Actinopolymorpha singaporensis TaxID=117157 RepID=A0A1H1LYW0_9ACTN|nr:protein translocase subunit SecD [Actinopolymorpha singaporensis]SDR79798.1 SecD/SecF fusion protein [Actinopolymorpha singaporensis]
MSGDSTPERPSASARSSARARSSASATKSRNRPASRPPGSRAPLLRALLTFGVLALALYFAVSTPARLGLDLRGGTQIVLETRDSPTAKANAESTDRALQVLNRRVDALGVSEPNLTRSGERRIIVELPGVQDPREAEQAIGRTAQLTFHPVLGIAQPAEKAKAGERILGDESGQRLRLGPSALTGEGVKDAAGATDPQQGLGWFVTIDFNGKGGGAWKELTAKAACAQPGDPTRRIAIVLDNKVISSPQVDPSIGCNVGMPGDSTQITGNFDQASAQELAVLIKGGALPVPVEIIEQRTVGPTLGAEAIEASAKAAVIGLALTGLFIIVVYRLMGTLATVALACYALISYAILVALGATLTLPGLAGFVLAIGMAIDANVLVFERAREEYAANPQKGLSTALTRGYKGAWSAILDSNVTTLLAAGLLFFLASGPVRGFGVTLSIGVLASMVSALVVARLFTDWAVRRTFVHNRPGITGLGSIGRVRTWLIERSPDLMKRGRLWLALSALVVIVAGAGIVVRGLDYGVEFTGGRLVEYSTSKPVDVNAARQAVTDAGFPRAVVQESNGDNITVRTGELSTGQALEIQRALGELGGKVTKQRDELIGPSLGNELRVKALIALGVALLAQMVYLAIRFRWTFGVAAVLAMLHDIVIVTGLFAWLGKPIDGVFLAAALTIIGLSVNDTVVVFDRVRELWAGNPKTPFARNANLAVLQTVPRTVNTGLGAMFILAALAILGGESLTDFAVALLVGLFVGTYSSSFTATPLAVELQARSGTGPPRVRTKSPAKAARKRAQRSGRGAVV